jgi:hypothetical protein
VHAIAAPRRLRQQLARQNGVMWLLILEALAALLLLVFIVWWTMFSGRPKDGDAGPRGGDDRPRDER